MNIFVVGSKPDAVFPDVVPDRVYAVNGAIGHAEEFAGTAEITGVITRNVVFSDLAQDLETRKQWAGKRVDRIIVSGSRARVSVDTLKMPIIIRNLGLGFDQFVYLGDDWISRILNNRNKLKLAAEVLTRLRSGWPKSFCLELKRTRILPELSVSGGIRALLIADREALPDSEIYLIGIGARKSRGHYYDPKAVFDKHANQDRNLLVDYKRRNPTSLVVTDRVLARYLRIVTAA